MAAFFADKPRRWLDRITRCGIRNAGVLGPQQAVHAARVGSGTVRLPSEI
jgi:hypothetical protein